MSSLCRLATSAFLEATPRKVASAAFSRSSILSSAALSAKPFEAPDIPKIFDIFDAPVVLRERTTHNESSKTFNILSLAREGSLPSKNIYDDALGLPWSLPPPVIFDGPAHPPHMSASALKKRRLQRQNLTLSPRRNLASSAVSCSALMSRSEILYELFDGPSRVTRFQYPTLDNEWDTFKYVSLALCLSTALGWFALKEKLEQNSGRSP